MKPKLFISHSTKDRAIAVELTQFLEQGLRIPASDIFCSSVPGEGIPVGENFIKYIRRELGNENVVVLLLITEHYLRSVFAVCELGATWALERKWIPLLVSPSHHKDVTDVLTGVQAYRLDTPEHVGLLLDELAKLFPQPGSNMEITLGRWEGLKRAFMEHVMEISMRPPRIAPEIIDPDEHDIGHSIEFYDKVAPYYDRGVSADFIQTHRELNRVIGRQLSGKVPTKLLDLGGGTGRILTAFESVTNLSWFYCDASAKMRDVFHSSFGRSSVVAGITLSDAEDFLRSDTGEYNIILASFLFSSMPYLIDLNLLKRRLADQGAIVVVEANPTYSETKPKFIIEDKVGKTFKYSLRIKPVDAPALATRASLVGLAIKELIGYDKGNQPYSYIATFQKA